MPGTGAPIRIRFAGDDEKALLPTGHVQDEINGHDATLVDAGMPVVLLNAKDFDIDGTESPAELEGQDALKHDLESIRLIAGQKFGFGDVSAQSVPKLALLSPPQNGGGITTRIFIPHRVHEAIGVLMATSVAAGVRIPGTVGHALARTNGSDTTAIEHPSGSYPAIAAVHQTGERWHLTYSANIRTARKIFDGTVFARPE